MQELQSLGHYLREEKINAGRVATGTGEAVNKAKLDRVFGEAEDDRDRRCCSFGRKCGDVAAGWGAARIIETPG
jgi:hypothetical protein